MLFALCRLDLPVKFNLNYLLWHTWMKHKGHSLNAPRWVSTKILIHYVLVVNLPTLPFFISFFLSLPLSVCVCAVAVIIVTTIVVASCIRFRTRPLKTRIYTNKRKLKRKFHFLAKIKYECEQDKNAQANERDLKLIELVSFYPRTE